jgi:hypothetical protein
VLEKNMFFLSDENDNLIEWKLILKGQCGKG